MAKRGQSEVWKYFEKEPGSSSATCNICQTVVKVKCSSTTNLHAHIKRHHPGINIDVSTKSKQKRSDFTNINISVNDTDNDATTTLTSLWTKLPTTSKRHKDISASIAKYIALDMRPLDSVNDRGFVQLIHTLEPRYSLQSRTHITETLLPRMFRDLKATIKDEIAKVQFVSLTTDSWTGRNSKSFTTVTVQYLDSNWNFQTKVLSTREVTESHTGENLAEDFKAVLEEWDLSISGVSVTTDNASNVSLAMGMCGVIHVRCMAHTLNLATQRALGISAVSKLLGKIRRVVNYFRRSTTAANLLRKAVTQLELPSLSLIIDVTTRWNSTADMLERYVLLRPAVYIASTNPQIRNQLDGLTEKELTIVEQLTKVI